MKKKLASRGERSALQVLLGRCLQDLDSAVRRAAVVALGQLPGPEVVDALIHCLGDADPVLFCVQNELPLGRHMLQLG